MRNHTAETLVGAVVLAIALGFIFYAGQLTGFSTGAAGAATYSASFRSIEGVSVGTDVRLGGVKVGTVTELRLNPETFRAETTFTVDEEILLPEDTAVLISSEGLLGGSYVELLPGGSPFNYEPGDEIIDTQSSVSFLNLLMKFVTGSEENGSAQ